MCIGASGNTDPTKSVALAGMVPVPVTAPLTLLVPVVLTERVTVKVKALLPLLPSVWLARVAAMARVGTVGPPTFKAHNS